MDHLSLPSWQWNSHGHAIFVAESQHFWLAQTHHPMSPRWLRPSTGRVPPLRRLEHLGTTRLEQAPVVDQKHDLKQINKSMVKSGDPNHWLRRSGFSLVPAKINAAFDHWLLPKIRRKPWSRLYCLSRMVQVPKRNRLWKNSTRDRPDKMWAGCFNLARSSSLTQLSMNFYVRWSFTSNLRVHSKSLNHGIGRRDKMTPKITEAYIRYADICTYCN